MGNWHHSFLVFEGTRSYLRKRCSSGLGCFPNEQKLVLYYKDTARTVLGNPDSAIYRGF